MLTYVDTLIGFAGVMLLLSLLITAIVQAAVTLFELRGSSLRWGVAMLLKRAVAGLSDDKALKMADQVLKHETLSPHDKLATAIRSDEFIRILDDIKPIEGFTAEFAEAKKGMEKFVVTLPVELKELFPVDTKKAEEVIGEINKQAREEMSLFKAWFDTIMDRTTERFVRWTRYWTIGTAVVLSFWFQIDSIGLLKQISSNPELRARLVQSADATLKLAENAASKEALASIALQAAVKSKPAIKVDAVPEKLVLRRDGVAWISDQVKEDTPRTELLGAFDAEFDKVLKARVPELAASSADIKQRLSGADLSVVEVKSPAAWVAWWKDDTLKHVFGVILTMVFLSLGGPFWFNLLRQLSNLRPLIAGKVDKAEQT